MTASADTYLRTGSANQAAGMGTTLQVQSSGNNRTLVRFDPAAIAAAVGSGSLASAQLELYIATNGDNWGSEGRTVDAHRLTAEWTEAGATWNCGIDTNPANAQANCTSSWNGGSFEEEPTDSQLHSNGQGGWVRYDVTSDVKTFLANAAANYGWLVKKTEEGQNGRVDYVSRQGALAHAPRLVLVAESPAFDEVPPALRITAPQLTPLVNDPSPAIAFEFADGGSGINPASLEVVIDGAILVTSCTLGSGTGSCEAPALAAGEHQVRIRIADHFGNEKEATRDFDLLLGPGLSSVSFPVVADTYLAKGQPNQEHGAESLLRVRKSGDQRALLRVDEAALLAAIGPGLVRSATLVLAITKNGRNWGSAGRPVDLHRLTVPWSEASATWSCAQDSSTTNNQANCSPQWNGGSFAAAPGDQLLVTNELAGVVELDVTADLEAAIESGGAGFGWLLKKADDGKSGLLELGSREGAANAPRLVLTLELPGMGGDDDPPTISWLAPAAGSWQPTATPALRAQLADTGSGVDPAAFQLLLDGVDRSAGCQLTAGVLQCTPAALAEGPHQARLTVRDLVGNVGEKTLAFSTDTVAPEAVVLKPGSSRVVGGATQEFILRILEVGSEIDLSGVSIRLDGLDLLTRCENDEEYWFCSADLAPGPHLLELAARDIAGNPGSAEQAFELVVDLAPPSLELTAPADGAVIRTPLVEVTGSASDDSGIVSLRVGGVEQLFESGAFSASVHLSPGTNEITASARDIAGNETMARRTVILDLEPPRLRLDTAGDREVNRALLRVSGSVTDDLGLGRVEVGGQAATVEEDGRFAADVTVPAGASQILVEAFDRAGNAARATLGVRFVQLPQIKITSPEDLDFLATSSVDITGTVDDPQALVVVDGVIAEVDGNSFIAREVPLIEGGNILTAAATNAEGHAGTDTIVIVRDSTSPHLAIHTPRAGAVVFAPTVAVSGMVNDIVAGTVNASEATVTVNGHPALVANRSFFAPDVPLVPGGNTLLVRATDETGNSAETSIEVRRQPAAGPRLVVVSGNRQEGRIGTRLAAPLTVAVLDAAGLPVAGVPVIFKTLDTSGAFGNGKGQMAVTTDGAGQASTPYTLGRRAGIGNEVIEASAAGFAGPATLVATARPGEATNLLVDAGDQQYGIAGQDLPRPLVAVVTDASFNRLQEVPVRFTVTRGGGLFPGGDSEEVAISDSDGRVILPFTLGGEEGIANNVVEARIESLPESQVATFTATARTAGDAAATSVSGVVLDNSDLPIEGVTLRILDSEVTAVTDAEGLFRLQPAPVGTIQLIVDGSTAERPGAWPDLEFVLTTIPGRENTVSMPIYLLPLDLENGLQVSETIGGTIRLPEVPGFALEIVPGSVTFPGGSKNGYVSVTAVHSDRVPMVPNFGQQPRFIVTIQPAGAQFDPPAKLTLPNVEGLAPREVTEMYSFDHDLGHFVSIGPATVSRNGATIVANAGVGVIKAGWHCGGNPPPNGTPHCCDPCTRCTGSTCVPDDRLSCTDKDPCTRDFCRGGSCQHEKAKTTDLLLELHPPFPKTVRPNGGALVFAQVIPKCPGIEVNLGVIPPPPGIAGYGHAHSNERRPLGQTSSCTTDQYGVCWSRYTAPEASGDDHVLAKVEQIERQTVVRVALVGLEELDDGPNYDRIYKDGTVHPSAHWAEPRVIPIMIAIANEYHAAFPHSEVLKINDMSLIFGGLFDYLYLKEFPTYAWKKPHATHREGRDADVRHWSIPAANRPRFVAICTAKGVDAQIHGKDDNRHYHLNF